MTVRVDYTQLDRPITLTLVRTPSGWHSVIDQHGRLYFPPVQDVTVCLRFLAAMASRKHAVVDDASVMEATWADAEQHSVKVPDLPDNVRPIRLAR